MITNKTKTVTSDNVCGSKLSAQLKVSLRSSFYNPFILLFVLSDVGCSVKTFEHYL